MMAWQTIKKSFLNCSLIVCLCCSLNLRAQETSRKQVVIPTGEFRPLFAKPSEKYQAIQSFLIDVSPVTNADYFTFVQQHPEWQREKASTLYVDKTYLNHWQMNSAGQFEPALKNARKPVVNISWFSARAFCHARNQRLPTTAEWEWVAMASDTETDARRNPITQNIILQWYSKPQTPDSLSDVGLGAANMYGVKDLHALIWEWTSDFNSILSTGESRADSTTDNQFFCGAGSQGAADPSDYATFMRYAMRASLQAPYTLSHLGFRCATSIETLP